MTKEATMPLSRPLAFALGAVLVVGAIVAAELGSHREPAEARGMIPGLLITDADYSAQVRLLEGRNDVSHQTVDAATYVVSQRAVAHCTEARFDLYASRVRIPASVEVAIEESPDGFQVERRMHVKTAAVTDPAKVVAANAAALEAEQACFAGAPTAIEQRYQLDLRHSPTKVRAESASFLRCLADAGMTVGFDESAREILGRIAIARAEVEDPRIRCVEGHPMVNTVIPGESAPG